MLVPKDKMDKLKELLISASKSECLLARRVASITGKIISLGLTIGSVARLRTHALYALLASKESWNSMLYLEDIKQEIQFWITSMHKYNAQPIWLSPTAVQVVYSDASDTGFGGYVVEHGGQVAHSLWSEQESKESSTWREIKAQQATRPHRVILLGGSA